MVRLIENERAGLGDDGLPEPRVREKERVVDDHDVRLPRFAPRELGKAAVSGVAPRRAAEEGVRRDFEGDRRGQREAQGAQLGQVPGRGLLHPPLQILDRDALHPERAEELALGESRAGAAAAEVASAPLQHRHAERGPTAAFTSGMSRERSCS